MIRLLTVVTVAAIAAAAVALAARPAASAGAGDPRIAVLQKQVKTLRTQTKALTAGLADARRQLRINFEGDTCLAALSADLVQGTWGVIDQIAQAAQQKTYFGPQTQLSDFQNCANLAQPDVPRPPI